MSAAERLPAPMALMTVAAPVATSPPAHTPFFPRAAPPPAASIGLAQFHLHAFHGHYLSFVVAVEPHRVGEQLEDDALLLGIFHFLVPRRHFNAGAAIDDVHL